MKKALKIVSLVVAAAAIVFAGTMFTTEKSADAKLPEYVGSQACLGCHSGKYERWEASPHAHMVDQIMKPSDMPADPKTAPEALKAELAKADYIVAGQRFLARDSATGELKYLNVMFDKAANQYVAYKGGSSWDQGCAGCHSTGWNVQTSTWTEPSIGCEMCHGPGRDHILGKGDVSKITASSEAAVCGQCHNGSGKAPTGQSWPVGYRPSMKSLDEVGFTYVKVQDPHGVAPEIGKPKMRQYAMWQASAHARAASDLASYAYTQDRCYACHSADANGEVKGGQKPDAKTHDYSEGVSCVTCHSPHSATIKGGNTKALCESCHNAEVEEGKTFKAGSVVHHPNKEMLNGYGAIGITNTKTPHSELSCVECHMTEGNHMMTVIKPEDVANSTRKDSCTACHKDSSTESRGVYLDLWQSSVSNKMADLQIDISRIDQYVKATGKDLGKLKANYDAAKTNLSAITADGSKGAHNFDYAMKILTNARKSVDEAKKALGL